MCAHAEAEAGRAGIRASAACGHLLEALEIVLLDHGERFRARVREDIQARTRVRFKLLLDRLAWPRRNVTDAARASVRPKYVREIAVFEEATLGRSSAEVTLIFRAQAPPQRSSRHGSGHWSTHLELPEGLTYEVWHKGSGKKEWIERGVGEVKLLQHRENSMIRVLMRQEKTMKIVANHYVLDYPPYCELQRNAGSEKCWGWSAQDCADGAVEVACEREMSKSTAGGDW